MEDGMKLTADDIAYLRQAAARDHYNPDDALKVFNYESSGRPDVWGGKGGKYYGIFQAGPAERAQFGIDTKNPSAKNQIDAFGKFLASRGFKPGMGLQDLYSTVLAGSPGHYNRSDGAGTVAQHVAKMSGGSPLAYSGSSKAQPSNIGELIGLLDAERSAPAAEPVPMPTVPTGLVGIRKAAMGLADEAQDEQDDQDIAAFQQAMLDFHNRNHAQALGLLGGE
jgi:hypothetical protein